LGPQWGETSTGVPDADASRTRALRPVGNGVVEVGVGDAGAVGPSGVLGRIVGEGHDRHRQPPEGDHHRRTGGREGLARAGNGDAGGAQGLQGVEQRLRTEVERVVVREGDAPHTQQGQRVDR
jgi:hypothetical protein